MKQKMVIKVSMPCEKSRTKAMVVAAKADGVISMVITGDSKDRLEVVGDGVDSVCLVRCLRKKLGHADILQLEEVKEPTPEEKEKKKKAEEEKKKKLEEAKAQPVVVHPPLPQWYLDNYHHHHYPPQPIVFCDEPSASCSIM
ncbi:hypothetical protein ACP70R_011506 [Stipagrostis hirtigluma subsp. patula]